LKKISRWFKANRSLGRQREHLDVWICREGVIRMTALASGDGSAAAVVRKFLLAILILGMLGSTTELILLKHTEDVRQWIPLTLLAVALSVFGWHIVNASPANLRLIHWLMIAFVASGVAGIYFHFQGSAEFKLEGHPSLRGWALFWEAIRGKAPPLLAPGAMIQLGLLGLAYSYKHPALSRTKK
jgi:hypothetical protein